MKVQKGKSRVALALVFSQQDMFLNSGPLVIINHVYSL
jgi:hypothetical protein